MAAKENGLVRKNNQYDQYLDMDKIDPGLAQMSGSEEPDGVEMQHYHTLYADFVEELYDNQSKNAEQMMGSAQDLFMGVSDVAFTILKAVYTKHDQRDGPVPQSVLFGEGGVIHSAVDEAFKFAQAYGIPGSDDQDQYSAAQINMMKKVGEYIEGKSDDEAVEESQDLLIDVEMADENYSGSPGPVGVEDGEILGDIAYQNDGLGEEGMEEEMPEEMPMEEQQGGLV